MSAPCQHAAENSQPPRSLPASVKRFPPRSDPPSGRALRTDDGHSRTNPARTAIGGRGQARSLRFDRTKERARRRLDRAIDRTGINHRGRKISERPFAADGKARDRLVQASATSGRSAPLNQTWTAYPSAPIPATSPPRMPYRTAQPRRTVRSIVNHSIVWRIISNNNANSCIYLCNFGPRPSLNVSWTERERRLRSRRHVIVKRNSAKKF